MQAKGKAATAKPPILSVLDSLAFFGSASEPEADVEALILCWPTTALAWRGMTDHWRGLNAPDLKRSPAVAATWVGQCAPQIGSVFADLAALETSVASLIARAAVQMAVAVSTPARRTARRELFVECLAGYREFLRTPGRSAFSAAVIDKPAGADDVDACFRTAIQGIPFASPPELHHWDGANSPIPLEIVRVASAAVARHLAHRDGGNPIFEAVRGKLVSTPLTLAALPRGRRR